MAQVEVEIGGRRYSVACRDGEEPHLRQLAGMVDQRVRDAAQALGNLSESRNLLFAALLLADDVQEARAKAAPPPEPQEDLGPVLEKLAERVEALAATLEKQAAAS